MVTAYSPEAKWHRTKVLPNKEKLNMKARLAFRAVAAFATTALVAAGLSAGVIAPAQAATKSTVTLLSSADITSLNSGTSNGNTSYNAVVGSLTGMGFSYYNSDAKLVMNTKFGSMKIVKNTPKDFQIQYTVAKGQTWSDGTPIDAVDLLLSHVVASDKYSKDAGLGDPAEVAPAFDSVSYGGTYGTHVVGVPTLSSDKMSLTVKFDKPLPDWELLAPGPSPVHALSLMADGKKGLQSASVNAAAKAKFLDDFTKKNTARLKKMGAVWSTGYDVTKVDSTTNPLLLISNGGFIVSKFTFGDSMTLVRNAKYSSGPAMATKNPIKTVVIKIIKDNTASVQALRNGDIDVYYNTLPTAADRTALEALPNVTVLTRTGGNYSHLDLRVDTANGKTDSYTGPFAGNSLKAKDLRKAFLLATPRQQLVDTIVKPVKSDATTLDSAFAFQGTPEYNTIVKGSGVSQFSKGTQAERTAQALALVKKYYPDASADNPVVKVKFVHANTSVRNALAKLIAAEVKKAGFEVEDFASADLFGSGDNSSAKYDVTMYGFGLNSISQANGTEIYKSDGGNNVWGWNDSALDGILKSLQGDILTSKEITAKRLAADKIIINNYWGLTLYANPTISAYNKALKNIKPAPIGANITWNFFEWSY
jgi:peptide/nickel transport system substrate-binding protein